jgi:hypothetical protein
MVKPDDLLDSLREENEALLVRVAHLEATRGVSDDVFISGDRADGPGGVQREAPAGLAGALTHRLLEVRR